MQEQTDELDFFGFRISENVFRNNFNPDLLIFEAKNLV
jgi:hypothetical protein